MSGQLFTIKVRIGNNEIELSGSRDDVLKTLDDLATIIGKFSGAFNSSLEAPSTNEIEEKVPVEQELPTISISPSAPCPEAIVKILSTEWGRSEPRTLGELVEAMNINAVHYPKGTVKGRLTDLTKKSILRRIRSGRGYKYILIKPE